MIDMAIFRSELAALDYLEKLRWPHGVFCPTCNSAHTGQLNGQTRLGTRKCYTCRKQFHVTHGTVMANTHLPVNKWLQVIFLGNSVSARQLATIIECNINTANNVRAKLRSMEAANVFPRQRPDHTGSRIHDRGTDA